MAQEGVEVDVLALVLAGHAVNARSLAGDLLVAVQGIDTSLFVVLYMGKLLLLDGFHGHGIGGIESPEFVRAKSPGVCLVVSDADAREGEQEGSQCSLHFGRFYEAAPLKWKVMSQLWIE